ncbi:MAG: SPFH domain-containing protein [Microscillaceae bacterium]|nr:SPFH domain-containing protein [Microscillaceae bacterium]
MLGIKYIKFDAMTHVIHYVNGKIRKEGRGLAFFYFAPKSSIFAIPVGSNDIPFVFHESTADYQTVSIQGQITYKVADPKKLAELLDFSVDSRGNYKRNDAEKIPQRLSNEAQTATSNLIHSLKLQEAIRSAKRIEEAIMSGMQQSEAVNLLGIVPISVTIIAIKATPEMERALEAETREALQQKADQATYERRNFAVEQERTIKESELNTEIALEEKKKQIVEKQMETEVLTEENKRKIRELKMAADISLEDQKKKFLDIKLENDKKQADAKSYALEAALKPYQDMDWKKLMVLLQKGDQSKTHIAMAFHELAENANKINQLNISPDLLQTLLDK